MFEWHKCKTRTIHGAETERFDATAIPPSGEKAPGDSLRETPTATTDPSIGSSEDNETLEGVVSPDITPTNTLIDIQMEDEASPIQFLHTEGIFIWFVGP